MAGVRKMPASLKDMVSQALDPTVQGTAAPSHLWTEEAVTCAHGTWPEGHEQLGSHDLGEAENEEAASKCILSGGGCWVHDGTWLSTSWSPPTETHSHSGAGSRCLSDSCQ